MEGLEVIISGELLISPHFALSVYSSIGMDMLQWSCGHQNNQISLLYFQNAWIVEMGDLSDENRNVLYDKGMINKSILSNVALLHK